jgi:hypothetical protein
LPWIDKKQGWLGSKDRVAEPQSRRAAEKKEESGPGQVYSVAQVAKMCAVDKKTIYNWMAFDKDDPGEYIIPPEAWFKLPGGDIRIREWIIKQLLNPT